MFPAIFMHLQNAKNLQKQQYQHQDDHRAGDLAALFQSQAGAYIVSGHVANSSGKTQQDDCLTVHQENHQAGNVGGQVDDLGLGIGGTHSCGI